MRVWDEKPGATVRQDWRDAARSGGEPSACVLKEPAPASGSIRGELVKAWDHLASSIFVSRRPIRKHAGRVMFGAVITFGLATIVFGLSRNFALSFVALAGQATYDQYGSPYAGETVGAFDSAGDGHFVVAIRSGLLDADAAHLFAGAGIVAGSKALPEFDETRWKLRGLMAAIGVR